IKNYIHENLKSLKNSQNSNISENHTYHHTNFGSKEEKSGFFYYLKKRYQEKRNTYKKNISLRYNKKTTFKSDKNSRINKSKTNLLKNEKKNKNDSIKIYEFYNNPDEDKINYIKRVYKKKYKKLISNEIENNSDSIIFNNNNGDKNKFCIEFYNTKNKIIDLNKSITDENKNNDLDTDNGNEKITVEFVKKKYNIIDLNQRINDSNHELIKDFQYKSEQEPQSLELSTSPSFNIKSSILSNNFESKSSASLSISEITSKETLNRIIRLSENKKGKKPLDTINISDEDEFNSISNEINEMDEIITMKLTNKSLSLRSLLRTYSSTPVEKDNCDDTISSIEIIDSDEALSKPSTSTDPISSIINDINDSNSDKTSPQFDNYTFLSFRKPKIFDKKKTIFK
ncbi:hypothetical protein PIROE2DRAFT_14868, partial [Piromyces sp. E2]